jgi:hypothetical protein
VARRGALHVGGARVRARVARGVASALDHCSVKKTMGRALIGGTSRVVGGGGSGGGAVGAPSRDQQKNTRRLMSPGQLTFNAG